MARHGRHGSSSSDSSVVVSPRVAPLRRLRPVGLGSPDEPARKRCTKGTKTHVFPYTSGDRRTDRGAGPTTGVGMYDNYDSGGRAEVGGTGAASPVVGHGRQSRRGTGR